MRLRIFVSALIGLAAGSFCFVLLSALHLGASDFHAAIYLAQRFLAHQNPYVETPLYPFTAALFGLPFVHVRPEIAAGIFYGCSTAALALGLTRDGYQRLLIFLAYPYWIGMLDAQWPTLIAAGAFFPLLMCAATAKPQIGIPVLISRFSWKGLAACCVVVALSLIAMPRWPWLWLGQLGHYRHFYAILVLPGPLVLLALLRYRDRDAIFLLSAAIMPMRWFYDAFILFLIPKSRREILITVVFSWCAGIWRWYHWPTSFTQVGRWIVLSTYLPMLVIVLMRGRQRPSFRESNAE